LRPWKQYFSSIFCEVSSSLSSLNSSSFSKDLLQTLLVGSHTRGIFITFSQCANHVVKSLIAEPSCLFQMHISMRWVLNNFHKV
jgi:hypothetical protein